MDEVRIVTVRCERRYLWRTVDQDGDVLNTLVQYHTDKREAMSIFKKLTKAYLPCTLSNQIGQMTPELTGTSAHQV